MPNLFIVSTTGGTSVKCVAAALTDVGRKRNHNEDSYRVNEALQLYVVADGMGGHAGGGTASALAVETIDATLREAAAGPTLPFSTATTLQASPVPDLLRTAVENACAAIFHKAESEPQLSGMGTTVIALCVHGSNAIVAHVGDSRAYLVRGSKIRQISEDHSLVNEQVKAGMLTPAEAKVSRYKNIITRSVGFEPEVQVDVMGLLTRAGDVFILCSDGLANLVEDPEIRDLVLAHPPGEAVQRLVALANERGGDDNITVIVAAMAAA